MMDNLLYKCGCGKDARYSIMRDGQEIGSCNKYQRCPTYEELYDIAQNRKSLLLELSSGAMMVLLFREGTSNYEIGKQTIEKIQARLESFDY